LLKFKSAPLSKDEDEQEYLVDVMHRKYQYVNTEQFCN